MAEGRLSISNWAHRRGVQTRGTRVKDFMIGVQKHVHGDVSKDSSSILF
jgi:hypothetical protein